MAAQPLLLGEAVNNSLASTIEIIEKLKNMSEAHLFKIQTAHKESKAQINSVGEKLI